IVEIELVAQSRTAAAVHGDTHKIRPVVRFFPGDLINALLCFICYCDHMVIPFCSCEQISAFPAQVKSYCRLPVQKLRWADALYRKALFKYSVNEPLVFFLACLHG